MTFTVQKAENTSVVNLLNTEHWGKEAESLKPIMEKMVYPRIREMPLQDLLFFTFLLGINVVIDAQERTESNDKGTY